MKILQINKYYYLKGGSERYFFDLSRLLERNGHQVIPFSMADSRNEYSKYGKYFIDKAEFKMNPKNIIKFFYNYDAVKRLDNLVKTEKPDVAHLHNIAHQISPAIIGLLKKYNIPMVQTLHDYKLICPNYKLFAEGLVCHRCMDKKYYNCFKEKCVQDSRLKSMLLAAEACFNNKILKLYNNVDLFLAPSGYLREKCIKFGVPQEKIKVLNYFLPDEAFCNDENKGQNSQSYLLYFGRISEEKGIDILLQAVEKLDDGVKLKIVGEGPEIKKIKSQAKSKKIENRVELLGAKYNQELQDIIKNAAAIIIPSIWPENMPYSLIESLALGKVVIASRIGGIPEFVSDKKNGFLFEPGKSDDLANKIKDLDKYDLYETGRKAEESVLKFDEKNHYREIMKIYKSIIRV